MEDKIKDVLAECERQHGLQKENPLPLYRLIKWRDDFYQAIWNEETQDEVRVDIMGSMDGAETERAYRLLGLGIQSPAPDENGLEKTLSWAFFEKFAKHFVEETSFDGSQVRPVMDFDNWQKAVKVAWNIRAHAPIAGKDPEKEELIVKIRELQEKYDENGYDFPPIVQLGRVESHVDGAFGIWQKQYNELKAKSSKLIEALEEIATHVGEDAILDWAKARNTAKKAIAAYKKGGDGA